MGPKEFRNWFRTIEFFERHSVWYFLSPDGLAMGPYASERSAEQQAVRLAKVLKKLNGQRRETAVIEFALNGVAA